MHTHIERYAYTYTHAYIYIKESVAKWLNCWSVALKEEGSNLYCFCIHFQNDSLGKCMNLLISPAMR